MADASPGVACWAVFSLGDDIGVTDTRVLNQGGLGATLHPSIAPCPATSCWPFASVLWLWGGIDSRQTVTGSAGRPPVEVRAGARQA
jgi:hypothetical protein